METVPAGQLPTMLEDNSSGICHALREIYPGTYDISKKAKLCLEAVNAFLREFGPERKVFVTRSAGRINLMGMHVDHRGGFTNPMALKEAFFVVEAREDDVVEIRNAEPKTFEARSFRIRKELPRKKIADWDMWSQHEFEDRQRQGKSADWCNYVKAAVLYLQHLYTSDDGRFDPALRGMNMAVKGNIPIAAGLSSSSAMVVGSAEACLKANGLQMSVLELVEACRLAEWYVGTRGGGGDHAAIKCGQKDHILHVGSFPFSVCAEPFPQGYSIVLADSLVQAKKQEGARDVFNQRVASYIFSLLMLRKNFPAYKQKMVHLRDVNPRRLGVSEGEIYGMLLGLPGRLGRAEILAELPEDRELIERTFRTHGESAEGYHIRQVCLYGIAECLRSEMAGELLRAGRMEAFGELINISHDGDRVSRDVGTNRVAWDNRISDAQLEKLAAESDSQNPAERERARLWRQPGAYAVSTFEQDTLVDIAKKVRGVIGSGLVGAGLGGAVIAVVEDAQAENLIAALTEQYYQRNGQACAAEIVRPVGGSGILKHSNKT